MPAQPAKIRRQRDLPPSTARQSTPRTMTAPAPGFLPPHPSEPATSSSRAEPSLASAGPPDSDYATPPIGAEPLEPPSTTIPGSSPASSPEPVRPIDRRALERTITEAVKTAGRFANAQLTDEDEHAAGIWLTDEHDEQGISKPVASFMARHAGPGVVNPDLNDAIAAAIAVAVYLSRQLSRLRELRRARMRAGMPTDHTPAAEAAA